LRGYHPLETTVSNYGLETGLGGTLTRGGRLSDWGMSRIDTKEAADQQKCSSGLTTRSKVLKGQVFQIVQDKILTKVRTVSFEGSKSWLLLLRKILPKHKKIATSFVVGLKVSKKKKKAHAHRSDSIAKKLVEKNWESNRHKSIGERATKRPPIGLAET